MRIPSAGIMDEMKTSKNQITLPDESSNKMKFQNFIKQEQEDLEKEEKPKIPLNIPVDPKDVEAEDALTEGFIKLNIEDVKTELPDEDEEEEKEEIDEDKFVTKGPVPKGKRITTQPYCIPTQTFSHFRTPVYESAYHGLVPPVKTQAYEVPISTPIEEVTATIDPLPGTIEDVITQYDVRPERALPKTHIIIKKDEQVSSPSSVKSDEGYMSGQSPTCSPNPHLASSPPYEPFNALSPLQIRFSPPSSVIPPIPSSTLPRVQKVAVYSPNILAESQFQSCLLNVVPKSRTPLQQAGRVIQESEMRDNSSYDRMQKRMNANLKLAQWEVTCKKVDVFQADYQGETDLMRKLRQPPNSKGFFESIYVLVERAKKDGNIEFLTSRNSQNQSALKIAALELTHTPLIARYIADSIALLKHSPDDIFDAQRNSLLHIMSQQGEDYAEVMAEFLNAEIGKEKLFDINRRNIDGNTPLHLAVLSNSVSIAKLLINHGADLKIKNNLGLAPLHLAIKNRSCSPPMIKQLVDPCITIPDYIDIVDFDKNTPLHYAAARNDLPINIQDSIVTLLIDSRAKHNLRNKDGRVALQLVDPARKDVIQRILNKKSSKMAYGK